MAEITAIPGNGKTPPGSKTDAEQISMAAELRLADAGINSYFGTERMEKPQVVKPKRSAPKRAAQDTQKAGALRGDTFILLHTFRAQWLVHGRPGGERNQIFGLLEFASYARDIFWCARMDDPYADWWLVKMEEAIATSEMELQNLAQEVETLLQRNPNFRIEVGRSEHPVRVDIQFSNPYAHRAANLVLHYDALICAIQTAAHVGLLDRDARERLLGMGAKPVRRAFLSATGYRARGITRQDIQQWTARGIEARALMGDCPEEVLNQSKRGRLAPDILPPDRRVARGASETSESKSRKPRRSAKH